MKTNWLTAIGYWFVHFSVEIICFFAIYKLFEGDRSWFIFTVLFDTLGFGPQAIIGLYCEKHPRFKPGVIGGVMLIIGAAIMLLGPSLYSNVPFSELTLVSGYVYFELVGIILLSLGNALTHIKGALVTLRVSEGRLSESAIFVGGGSFGLISGRILADIPGTDWIPFVCMIIAIIIMIMIDKRLTKKASREHVFDFDRMPCNQKITLDRSVPLIAFILFFIVCVRAYIGYALPIAWNKTFTQTIFLFLIMGTGKMLGGILSDIFGARLIGIISCLLSVPVLLAGNNIMWLSLIGVATFSMTMAVTLGGLVSVLPSNPGVAFGITTLGLLLGTLAVTVGLPDQFISNILICVLSVVSAIGFAFCLKPGKKEESNNEIL